MNIFSNSITLHAEELVFLAQKVEAFRTSTIEDISIIAIGFLPPSGGEKEWKAVVNYCKKKF